MNTTTQTETQTQRVASYLENCAGITWDECHKIYILMDEEEVKRMEDFEYQVIKLATKRERMRLIKNWYKESCPLKFVDVISNIDGEEKFTQAIEQCSKWR